MFSAWLSSFMSVPLALSAHIGTYVLLNVINERWHQCGCWLDHSQNKTDNGKHSISHNFTVLCTCFMQAPLNCNPPGPAASKNVGLQAVVVTPFTEHPCAPQVQALARLGCSRRACPAAVVSVPGQTPRSSPCEHPTFQLQSQLPVFPGHTQLPLTGITTPLHDASGTPSCATQVMHLREDTNNKEATPMEASSGSSCTSFQSYIRRQYACTVAPQRSIHAVVYSPLRRHTHCRSGLITSAVSPSRDQFPACSKMGKQELLHRLASSIGYSSSAITEI